MHSANISKAMCFVVYFQIPLMYIKSLRPSFDSSVLMTVVLVLRNRRTQWSKAFIDKLIVTQSDSSIFLNL
jgi:hypothetical protein